jgi:hypothetical protein
MRSHEFITEDAPESIRLGSTGSAAAKAWIEKVYALYPQQFQNNHVMPLGGSGEDQQFAMFELIPSWSRLGAVEVKWIQAYPLRQGVGSRAMQELQRLAQTDGIALTLFPWDKGQVSQSKLTKFYRGQGFAPTAKGSKSLAWSPKDVAEDTTNENFADGKNPERKGLSKRVGIPQSSTLAQLEKITKSSTGERRQMAQWQLNMRRGKAKK